MQDASDGCWNREPRRDWVLTCQLPNPASSLFAHPAAVMGTVYPGTYMRGNRETFGLYPNEPNFPR